MSEPVEFLVTLKKDGTWIVDPKEETIEAKTYRVIEYEALNHMADKFAQLQDSYLFEKNKNKVLTERIQTLFKVLAHGDYEHQKWLKKAINDHFKFGQGEVVK